MRDSGWHRSQCLRPPQRPPRHATRQSRLHVGHVLHTGLNYFFGGMRRSTGLPRPHCPIVMRHDNHVFMCSSILASSFCAVRRPMGLASPQCPIVMGHNNHVCLHTGSPFYALSSSMRLSSPQCKQSRLAGQTTTFRPPCRLHLLRMRVCPVG